MADAQDAGGSYFKHILLCTTSVAYGHWASLVSVSGTYQAAPIQPAASTHGAAQRLSASSQPATSQSATSQAAMESQAAASNL